MEKNSYNTPYLKWNLEQVGQLLYRRICSETNFKNPNLWIICASRWIDDIFACYDNFLPFTPSGLPDYDNPSAKAPIAWEQMSHLLENGMRMLKNVKPNLDVPLQVMGFSKGGCVVTKLFYELSQLSGFSLVSDKEKFTLTSPTSHLVSKVTDLYWLDAGHSGNAHQWPTSEHLISSLHSTSCPKLHVEATPYQVMNNQQPWKSHDFNTFVQLLSKYSLPFKKTIHFTSNLNAPRSLETHFEILNHFSL